MIDFRMMPTLALLLVAVLVPMVAGVTLLLFQGIQRRPGSGRGIALLGVGLGTVSVWVAIATGYFQAASDSAYEQVSRIGIGETVLVTLFHDWLAIVWMLLFSLASWVGLSSHWDADESSRSLRVPFAVWLLLTGTTLAMSLVSDALLQWILLSTGTWLAFAYHLTARNGNSTPPVSCRLLVTLSVADLLWMFGLMSLNSVFGTLEVPLLLNPAAFASLGEFGSAVVMMATMCLILSLLVRLSFFPMILWTREFANTDSRTALLLIFPLGTGAFLLFRWCLLLTAYPEASTLLAGVAALTVFLLSSTILFQPQRVQLTRAFSVTIGILIIGLVVQPRELALFTSGGCLAIAALSLTMIPSFGVTMRSFILTLLMSGLFGQELAFRSLLSASYPDGVQLPFILAPILITGHGLTALALFRSFANRIDRSCEVAASRCYLTLVVSVALIATPTFVAFSFWTSGTMQLPLISGSVTAMAWFGARFPMRDPADVTLTESNSFVRLAKQDFYLESMLSNGLVAPLRAIAWACHCFDELLFERLFWRTPAQFIGPPPETRPNGNGASPGVAPMLVIAGVTVVLLIAVLAGQ